MANKMFAEVVIAGSYKELAKSTKGASDKLNIFQKNAEKVSKAVSGALAGIALAALQGLGEIFVDTAKAAAADAKSTALLNKQMENTWHASKKTEERVSKYLDTMSNMTGIVDDELKPAFAKIVTVTKKASTAQKVFSLAMDVSAGTGKDLNAVSQAFAKYLGGNEKALNRMVPGLSEAKNKMAFLQTTYAGMAAAAGANDPFARINAVMDNFKEKIGKAFLPFFQMIADWLASDASQKAMDDFAKSVQDFFSWLTSEEIKKALNDFSTWIADAFDYLRSPEGQKQIQDFIDKTIELANSILGVVDSLKQLKPLADLFQYLNPDFYKNQALSLGLATGIIKPDAPKATPVATQPGIAINVYGTQSGDDVLRALKKTALGRGQTLGQLLK